ncbi:MAG: TonB-dependent receptor [Alphaproteobacteria bacterium]|nr:TonB-dependent receptor [Alphaproteobacteria bacterium]
MTFRTLCAAAALLLAVAPQAGGAAAEEPRWALAQAGAAAEIAFDIPAQPLGQALVRLADRAGIRILFASELVAGKRGAAVAGRHTPAEALGILLAGSGLGWRFIEPGTVTVEPSEAAENGRMRLNPVTVLGSRNVDPAPLSNVPASITVVDRETIRSQQATAPRIEDILSREVPGFNPTNNGVRQIRGRTAQVFINGVPVNEQLRASSGSDLNLVTPDQLDAVEVSRGANSAYGFGSPGGIIALSTPRAESTDLALQSRASVSVNPHHPGGSLQTTVYQSASRIIDKFDFHLGGALGFDGNEFDPRGDRALGFNSPNGLANNKEFLSAFDGSFGYDLGEAGRLRLAATYSYVDAIEGYDLDGLGTYRVTQSSVQRNRPGDDNYREGRTVNLSYEQPDLFGSALKLELFNSDTYTESFSVVGGRISRDEQYNQYYGVRSGLTTPLDSVRDGMTVSYGVDAIRNRYYRPTFFTDTGELRTYFSPDVTLDTLAPYVQLEAPFGPLRLSGGVRHERYSGSAETVSGNGGIQGGDIQSFNLTLFNAGAVYALRPALDLFATYTQGAEITQIGRAARSASTAEEIDPQPAKSDQYEVGLRGDWRSLSATVAAFYTESDLISSLVCDGVNPCTPLREPRKIWGLEATADWKIDRQWSLGGILGWQDGVRYPEGADARRIGTRDNPPLTVGAFVRYSPYAWWRNAIRFDYRHSRDEFGDSTAFDEGEIDSVFLVHLSAEFDVGRGVLRLGVRNLLNEKYFSIASESGNNGFTWVPEEGTRVSVSYALKW